jgi:hypothetical protein
LHRVKRRVTGLRHRDSIHPPKPMRYKDLGIG